MVRVWAIFLGEIRSQSVFELRSISVLAMLTAHFYGVRAGIRTPKKLLQINQTRNEGCLDNTCKGVGKETESDLGCFFLVAETIEFADRFYVEVREKEASNKTPRIFGLT